MALQTKKHVPTVVGKMIDGLVDDVAAKATGTGLDTLTSSVATKAPIASPTFTGIPVAPTVQFTGGTRPTADVEHRGCIWIVPAAPDAADTIEVCVKLANNTYAWVNLIYTGV